MATHAAAAAAADDYPPAAAIPLSDDEEEKYRDDETVTRGGGGGTTVGGDDDDRRTVATAFTGGTALRRIGKVDVQDVPFSLLCHLMVSKGRVHSVRTERGELELTPMLVFTVLCRKKCVSRRRHRRTRRWFNSGASSINRT